MFKLIYFTAEWCNQCKLTAPAVYSAAAYFNIEVSEVDAGGEDNNELLVKYDVMALPTIVLMDGGKELARTTGAKNADSIINEFSKFIK